jgi:hypothetical protein
MSTQAHPMYGRVVILTCRFRASARVTGRSPPTVAQHDALKTAYEAVEQLVAQLPAGRYRALALRHSKRAVCGLSRNSPHERAS